MKLSSFIKNYILSKYLRKCECIHNMCLKTKVDYNRGCALYFN